MIADRFIPACAGNSAQSAKRASSAAVHPRVRGEQRTSHADTSANRGSSPRARGTEGRAHDAEHGHRFIPRARGTGCLRSLRSGDIRFIPACAGNRRKTCCAKRLSTVHPRVRGEQSTPSTLTKPSTGSSPRARGTVDEGVVGGLVFWFIPACAGNRGAPNATATYTPVHPRVRGEQKTGLLDLMWNAGSSPRARGTGCPLASGFRLPRFIPACAGNSRRGLCRHRQ